MDSCRHNSSSDHAWCNGLPLTVFLPTSNLSQLPVQIVEVNPLFFEVIERMAFWPWGMQAEQQASLITVFL